MQKLKLAAPAEQAQVKVAKAKDTTASVWNKDWKYTPKDEVGPDYLAKKFKRIQREQAAQQAKKVIGRVK